MNRIHNTVWKVLGCAVLALALGACDMFDTAVQPLELVEGDIARDNPELYAAYLKNLKDYKASDHILVYTWFRNDIEKPFSRSHHFTMVPDSVDYIAPMTPETLPDWQRGEMVSVRSEKGTKFLYTIDFDAIKAAYNAMMELDEENEPTYEGFQQFLTDQLQSSFEAFDRYTAVYDGIVIGYQGKGILHMTASQLKEYKANENLFLGMINGWIANHPDKEYTFMGKPQNVLDPSLFGNAKSLILNQALDAANPNAFDFYVRMSMAEGVPNDKFGMVAYTPTSNPVDPTRKGYITDDTFVVDVMADWAATRREGFTINSIALYDINEDYYTNPSMIFYHTRYAINTVNPAIK